MKPDPEIRFKLMHQLYCDLSGRPIPWTRSFGFRWASLALELDNNISEELETALVRVIQRIKRLSDEFSGYRHHLNISKILDSEIFLEHWAAAMAESRKPKVPAGLREVLIATGRSPEPPTSEPVSAAVALERTKLAEELAAWRKSNL